MASVDHHEQHHPSRTSPGLDCLQGCANGASCEDHIINQHHISPFHTDRKICGLHHACPHTIEIIAMKGGIKASLGERVPRQSLQLQGQHPCQLHATGGNAKQEQILAAINRLEHLSGQALKGPVEILCGENFDAFGSCGVSHGWVAEAVQCMGADVSKS